MGKVDYRDGTEKVQDNPGTSRSTEIQKVVKECWDYIKRTQNPNFCFHFNLNIKNELNNLQS